ncbi:cystatin-B-like [Antennarius striatus]|uniref:cystatin-B-like n=1 Tax=Antennarius striatus TaxID=241820 RepID=UPI0035B41BFE
MDTKGSPCLGGLSDLKVADSKTLELCNAVKSKAEQVTRMNFNVFSPITYKDQVVGGMNYFIKAHVGEEEYVHLRVYEKLLCNGGTIELNGIQVSKTLEDEILYFEQDIKSN